ncbi:MAG: elongation factor G [Alphaproteobacteria bacterium]|nr:elongation factor G [Alphaproteobacteria bacterium]
MSNGSAGRPRCAVLVGPYLSGKTSLLESILHITGATQRRGTVKDGNMVGDYAPEARKRQMSIEVVAANTNFLGDQWTFLDCPGSIEFAQDAYNACMVADVAVVVCEPEPDRALAVSPLLRFLDERRIPHMVFINKLDAADDRVRDVLSALQAVSERPLVLRQVPIRDGETITGYVDLISERAYRYQPGKESALVALPDEMREREQTARQELLETLADFDDKLLEQLLEDTAPAKQDIYQYLAKTFHADNVVPVLIGAGERDHGVRRLLKALRHDTPEVGVTRARLGIEAKGEAVVQVCKTLYAQHTGKLAIARVWHGDVKEGMTLKGERLGSLVRLVGQQQTKIQMAHAGEVVGLGRVEGYKTGDVLTPTGGAVPKNWPPTLPPIYALAIHAENRSDEVKLSGALQRLVDEDASYSIEHNVEMHQLLLWGQGEQHLQIGLDRLRGKYNVAVQGERPLTAYRETIRKGVEQHARFKRQSGGHGQFADIHVDIKPLQRGEGFSFGERIVGGAIPRNFIPAVEAGVREYLPRGPLGFPVVDVAVELFDGKFHAVDSSDMAFKTAGRMAMSEGMPLCNPVLLEPILLVTIFVPNEFTAGAQRLLSGRRGQILGYDARAGWNDWDQVQAHVPQAEVNDMIIELRSLTRGVGTFEWKFDHLQELTGRLADDVVKARAEAAQ